MNRAAPLAAFVALALCACRQDSSPAARARRRTSISSASWATGTSSPASRPASSRERTTRSSRTASRTDGTIDTTFTFRKDGFDGELKRYTPRGFVRDGTGNAVWGMRFVWPIKADYRIAWLDRDYTLTVVGREARDYVWIMARRRRSPSPTTHAGRLRRRPGL